MKKSLQFVLFLAAAAMVISCTSARDKEIRAISVLEKQLENEAAKPDPQKLNKLLDDYTSFVDQNKSDSLAPLYLYKAVNLCIATSQGNKAMELIDRTLNEYPASKYLPTTVFLKAYVYENLLSDYGKASEVYQDFLKKYPGHQLADDAQAALDNLGKSPEELVREFEERNAAARVGK